MQDYNTLHCVYVVIYIYVYMDRDVQQLQLPSLLGECEE